MTTVDNHLLTNNVELTPARAFTASELVACPSCSRANSPTRASCLYCGAVLGNPVEATTSTMTATAAEKETEDVAHVVVVSACSDGREVSADIAQLLNLAPSELNSLLSGRGAPLYATTATNEVHAILDKLRSVGLEPLTISDGQLNLTTPQKQIAALAMDGDALTASVRRTGERISVRWDDLVLIVLGRLYFTTTEVEQTPDKSKKVLDERQLTSDEEVLDLYSLADETGWRIRANNFDYSCLGTEKKLIAFENFRALADLLRRSAADAVYDDDYVRLRVALNKVWPLELRSGASERRRTLTGDVSAIATVSDNELQFTRYSRLLRFIVPQLQADAEQS